MDISTELVDDGGINHQPFVAHNRHQCQQSVELSLNKRKRWLLPDLIKSAIDEIKAKERLNDKKSSFKVTMLERSLNPLNPQGNGVFRGRRGQMANDCIGYHDSETVLSHVLSQRPYSFNADLVAKAKGESGVVKNKIQVRKIERRLKIRSHSRGIQRHHEKKIGWRE